MNTSDSADELVRLYIDGMDKILRITGTGAKNIVAILLALTKEHQQTKGKSRLNNMLKSGKPLQIFTLKAEDLKKFSQEAKKYGILYCVLADKKNAQIDGEVDIMIRDEDAPKINRIAERFNFRSVASIERELELEKEEKGNLTEDEKFIEDIMPIQKEQKELPSNTNDTVEKSPLEPSLNTKVKDKVNSFENDNKKSVKEELKEITEELKAKENQLQNGKNTIEMTNQKKEKRKSKPQRYKENNGKHFKEARHLDNSSKKKRRKKKRERGK